MASQIETLPGDALDAFDALDPVAQPGLPPGLRSFRGFAPASTPGEHPAFSAADDFGSPDRKGLLFDPQTGAALTRSGWVAVRPAGEGREPALTADEKARTRTLLQLDLPFRLSKFEGLWTYDNGVELVFSSVAHPLRHAAYLLGFPAVPNTADDLQLTLEPDDRGLAGRTRVLAVIPKYVPLPARHEHARLLGYVARLVNQVVTLYCRSTGHYGIRPFSSADVVRYEFRHLLLPGREVRTARVFYYPGEARPRLAAPAAGDEALFARVTRLSRLDETFRGAVGLMVEARRALAAHEARSAAVLASAALEAGVLHAIELALLARPTLRVTIPAADGRQAPRVILAKTFNKVDPRFTAAEALHVVLRQVMPPGVPIPAATLDGCDRLMDGRSRALHGGPLFEPAGVESAVAAAESLLDLLIEHRPGPDR